MCIAEFQLDVNLCLLLPITVLVEGPLSKHQCRCLVSVKATDEYSETLGIFPNCDVLFWFAHYLFIMQTSSTYIVVQLPGEHRLMVEDACRSNELNVKMKHTIYMCSKKRDKNARARENWS